MVKLDCELEKESIYNVFDYAFIAYLKWDLVNFNGKLSFGKFFQN